MSKGGRSWEADEVVRRGMRDDGRADDAGLAVCAALRREAVLATGHAKPSGVGGLSFAVAHEEMRTSIKARRAGGEIGELTSVVSSRSSAPWLAVETRSAVRPVG